MWRRCVLLVLRLYPFDWRERYGAEVTTLIEDAGLTWRTVPNLIHGAIAEWIALASSPDRRCCWLRRPSGRRLYASVALLVPTAAIVASARIADVLAPLVADRPWLIPTALVAGIAIVVPLAMWRFLLVGATETSSGPGPVGAERHLWFAILLIMQLITHVQLATQSMAFARLAETLPWPAVSRWLPVLSYFTFFSFCLMMLWMQSAARRFERVTGVPLRQPRSKPSVPPHPLGL